MLNNEPYVKGQDMEGLAYLPDGAIKFYEASTSSLIYRIQINDVRVFDYHRSNGITKLKYFNPISGEKSTQLTVPEGMLSIMDFVSRSYLNSINPNAWIVSGIQYMPIIGSDKGYILGIIGLAGACLYPIALGLLLPIFMYVIVLEKEEKLLEMMKMNG